MGKDKIVVKSQWDEKYLREQPFMPFGSMMNAFGRSNQGKGMSLDAFEIASDKIFELSQKYITNSYNVVSRDDSMDIPTKK